MSANPTDFNKRLGAAVRARRVLAGLSQSDVAKALDVTFQQQQKREKGMNRISAEDLVLTAKILNTTTQQLLDEACAEIAPTAEPVNRVKLNAMRGLSRMSQDSQAVVLSVINALVGKAA